MRATLGFVRLQFHRVLSPYIYTCTAIVMYIDVGIYMYITHYLLGGIAGDS